MAYCEPAKRCRENIFALKDLVLVALVEKQTCREGLFRNPLENRRRAIELTARNDT